MFLQPRGTCAKEFYDKVQYIRFYQVPHCKVLRLQTYVPVAGPGQVNSAGVDRVNVSMKTDISCLNSFL